MCIRDSHDVEFHVIVPDSSPLKDVDLTGVKVRTVIWDKVHDVDQLREIDIGIMPLFATDDWDRYKCGLKLIQYMAVGMPAVASPVGVNSTIVSHGCDGFLASNDAEWESCLRQLIENEGLRLQLGAAARETVQTKYSVEANFSRYETALRDLLRETD